MSSHSYQSRVQRIADADDGELAAPALSGGAWSHSRVASPIESRQHRQARIQGEADEREAIRNLGQRPPTLLRGHVGALESSDNRRASAPSVVSGHNQEPSSSLPQGYLVGQQPPQTLIGCQQYSSYHGHQEGRLEPQQIPARPLFTVHTTEPDHANATSSSSVRQDQPLHQLPPGNTHNHRLRQQNHPPYVLATPPADIVAPPYSPHHQQIHYRPPPLRRSRGIGAPVQPIRGDPASPPLNHPNPQSQPHAEAPLCHPHDPRLLQPQPQQDAQANDYLPRFAASAHIQQHAAQLDQLDHEHHQLVTATSSSFHSQPPCFPTPLDHTGIPPGADDDRYSVYHPDHIQQFYQQLQLSDNWSPSQRPDGLWPPLMHPDLSSILNAESYNDGSVPTFRAPRSLPPQSSPISASTSDAPPPPPPQPNLLKRPQSSAVAAEEEAGAPVQKRPRGRPKLPPGDVPAIERRRHQIRVAQQNYRGRKDEVRNAMKRQIKNLTARSEQMTAAFMDFHDYIVAEGLVDTHPGLGRELQVTTERFLELAQSTIDTDDEDAEHKQENHHPDVDSRGSTGKQAAASGSASGSVSASPGDPGGKASDKGKAPEKVLLAGIIVTHEPDLDYTPAQAPAHTYHCSTSSPSALAAPQYSSNWSQGGASTSLQQQHADAPCEVISQPTVHNASFPFGMSIDTALETNIPFIDPSINEDFDATFLPSSFPPPPPGLAPFMPPTSLPPPSTFSHQERTFGRRLQRAALEKGIQLLSMPDAPTHFFAGVFGFCLLFENRDMILRRLTDCLSMNQHETLSNWRFPFLHLGGAGTFFGENNEMDDTLLAASLQGAVLDHAQLQNNAQLYKPYRPYQRQQHSTLQEQVGNRGLSEPHRSKVAPDSLYGQGPWGPAVEGVKDLRVDRKLRIVMPGWEGDFFDCDEIEWYFQQRGIVIPPAADVIAAEIDDDAFMTAGDGGRTTAKGFEATIDGFIADWLTRDFVKDGPGARVAAHLATPSTSTDTAAGTPIGEVGVSRAEANLTAGMQHPSDLGVDAKLDSCTMPSAPGKRLITLNVDLLVNELVARSVCLGRTPGVRPKDVDAAFWSSVTLI